MEGKQERKPNRLIKEKSPYLQQHAYNPVDWYPWGAEAFEKAAREKKPIFLSIGYSTCHWCHVMAHESFEDSQVAELLNKYFVSVKVDREERPDIDAVYMAVCQAVTGSGGWPLTLVLDTRQNPFFVGTYFPKTSRYGRQGLLEILKEIHRQWQQDAGSLMETGRKVTEYLKAMEQAQESAPEGLEQRKPDQMKGGKPENKADKLLGDAALWFEQHFDKRNGGFGRAPKFPQAHQLIFLMRYGERREESRFLSMAELTLQAMYRGGIFDQIGGGFSRYSTDDQWLVPHFEKMLYDNALLSDAYLEAFKQTKNPKYREAVQRILAYVKRELLQDAGGFSCGQDADSQGEEGKYYLFDREEILDVLGEDRGNEFCRYYNVTERGNFEGKNILNRIGRADEKQPFWWEEAVELLLSYRRERMALNLDDKVLTSWNCLMIGACAKAAVCLGQEEYGEMARASMRFLRANLKDEKGGLLVRWRDGQAAFPGQLEDHAFYALACLELYEAFGKKEDFQEAVWAAWEIPKLFGDERGGGYFRYSTENEALIIRPKEAYDGAIPSGNGAAALVFSRIYHMTGMPAFGELRDRQLDAMERLAAGFPAGYTLSLLAILEAQKEIGMCSLEDAFQGTGSEACRMQGKQYGWAREIVSTV